MPISTTDFIAIINDPKIDAFEHALVELDDLADDFDLRYQDPERNGLVHLVIKALVEKLVLVYTPFQNLKRAPLCADLPNEAFESLKVSVVGIVRKMLEINIPYTQRNVHFQRPLDYLIGVDITYCDTKAILAPLIKVFEADGLTLYPGRKYVTSLQLFRSSKRQSKYCEIPDSMAQLDELDRSKLTLHQRQALYENYLHRIRQHRAINLVIANFGFVISDIAKTDPAHKPIFITLPIRFKNYLFYAEAHNHGTHSEGALCSIFYDREFLEDLFKQLQAVHPYKARQKIYALVLDVHSTAEVCKDCQNRFHKLQSEYGEQSFLKRFEQLAIEQGYCIPQKSFVNSAVDERYPKLRLIVRASGVHATHYSGDDAIDTPAPAVYTFPIPDIKSHPQKVFFHLPPNASPWIDSRQLSSFSELDCTPLLEYQSDFREHYRRTFVVSNAAEEVKASAEQAKKVYSEYIRERADIYYPAGYVALYKQTAFTNTRGNARSHHLPPLSEVERLEGEPLEVVLQESLTV